MQTAKKLLKAKRNTLPSSAYRRRDSFKLRKANLSDLDSLIILENKCFTSDCISRNSYRNFLTSSSAEILVATYQQKIIGCAVILFRKFSKKARLYSLAVDKSFRRHGVAIALNKIYEKNARKRHCNQIILEVKSSNQTAIRFYQKQNYVLLGKYSHYYEDGGDALRMVKTLCHEK